MLTQALCAMILGQAQWIAPTPPVAEGPTPSWIWGQSPGQPAPSPNAAPEGSMWFARDFDAPIGAVRGRLAVAADNRAVIYLNGQPVLTTTSWSGPAFAEVPLREGRNLLAVEATNSKGTGRNPAGLIARLAIDLPGAPPRYIITDADWLASDTRWPGFPAEPPASVARAAILGPAHAAPWSLSPAAFNPPRPCPMLRRSFTLDDKPSKATIRVIGLGHYELRCNGSVVGDTLINQPWSQYDRTIYWQEFDLAPYLRAGENVLGVTLGNSFWCVDSPNDSGRYSKTDAMPDFSKGWPHLLWLDAALTTRSGERRIVSDDAWRWAESPLAFSHIYAGEDFDARLAQPGWDSPAFDAASWNGVTVAPAPAATPAPGTGPGMKAFEVFTPSEIKEPAPGIFTCVFPQNCSALLRFTLKGGNAGSRVRFRPCEYMDDSGRVKFTYTWGTGKDIWHDYVKRGVGEESHQTLFCFVGAQFVQVEGAVPEGRPNPDDLPVLTALEQIHVRAACPIVGTFESSSAMHNAAHRIIDWSIRSNMAHVPMDCPHREKNGWLEQDWHMAAAMSYTYDVDAWLGKTCHDIRDAQRPDGHVPTNSPNYLVGVPPHGFWNNAPEWGISAVLVPWHLYEWYGDRQALEANFDAAKRYIDYLTSTAKDGVITSNLGDWYDFGHDKGNGPSQWTPNEVSATAMWALGAHALARSADVLGRKDEAATYRTLFGQIRRDFQRRFYDGVTKTVQNKGSCQAANSAALCIDLIPAADRESALNAVIDDLEKRGWKQTPGEVLQVFLIRALAEGGRGDVLHRIYNREDIPSYGHMVKSGLTTLPESWDARRGTGDSLNHFMLGHLMEWHYAYVVGIRQQPGSVAWRRVLIAPQPPPATGASPNAMRSASAVFHSPAGTISASWKIVGGQFELTSTIPPEAECLAVLPDGSRHPLPSGTSTLRCAAP
ncbi:Alpha-L-rhamnosidase [Phycisphaerales bacterium]|nr:Alpha-L-rhamnosidase [Phycisphaerales bacterium]